MDQGPAPAPSGWSLRSRGPAHAVSHRCLERQREARPRGAFARLLGVDPLHPDAADDYRTALGERRVGGVLGELGDGWRVLHAVPYGDTDDIDHLVIGPPGVFAVTSSAAAAQHDARSASRMLTRAMGSRVVAEPVVASPHDVHGLVERLRGLPARLEADLVATITRAAEEWTTWRPFGVDLPVHTDPDHAFDRLRIEVERARRRRLTWTFAGFAAVPIAVFATVVALVG